MNIAQIIELAAHCNKGSPVRAREDNYQSCSAGTVLHRLGHPVIEHVIERDRCLLVPSGQRAKQQHRVATQSHRRAIQVVRNEFLDDVITKHAPHLRRQSAQKDDAMADGSGEAAIATVKETKSVHI